MQTSRLTLHHPSQIWPKHYKLCSTSDSSGRKMSLTDKIRLWGVWHPSCDFFLSDFEDELYSKVLDPMHHGWQHNTGSNFFAISVCTSNFFSAVCGKHLHSTYIVSVDFTPCLMQILHLKQLIHSLDLSRGLTRIKANAFAIDIQSLHWGTVIAGHYDCCCLLFCYSFVILSFVPSTGTIHWFWL